MTAARRDLVGRPHVKVIATWPGHGSAFQLTLTAAEIERLWRTEVPWYVEFVPASGGRTAASEPPERLESPKADSCRTVLLPPDARMARQASAASRERAVLLAKHPNTARHLETVARAIDRLPDDRPGMLQIRSTIGGERYFTRVFSLDLSWLERLYWRRLPVTFLIEP
jgi:hypothetical protein